MTPKRSPIWLPYLDEMRLIKPDEVFFKFNGGEIKEKINTISSIMIYGECGNLDIETVETISRKGIPILIHRRNIATPIWICTGVRGQDNDILTKQLLMRANEKKLQHITRRLLEAKFETSKWCVPSTPKLSKLMNINQMRLVEARHAKKYWSSYYSPMSLKCNRRDSNELSTILNAVSKFVSGITLRWITYHHLSPYHGFCHTPTDYPALVYDLMEPYRGMIEKRVFKLYFSAEISSLAPNHKLGAIINEIKKFLDEEVYCGLTRQIITRHELFHGVVLALRSYLIGESKFFHIPLPTKPNGGRPQKVNFKLYGRYAGKTSLWYEAKRVTSNY